MHESDSLALINDLELAGELVFLDARRPAASAAPSEPTAGGWCVDFDEVE